MKIVEVKTQAELDAVIKSAGAKGCIIQSLRNYCTQTRATSREDKSSARRRALLGSGHLRE
jgi:hypothetical protein